MAVSLDTYDSQTGIHPRQKQIPCKRLATAGLNVAYGMKDFPTNGPFPAAIKVEPLPDPNGRLYVEITYDQPITWNPTETEGFYVCTNSDLTNFCNGGWQKVCLLLYDLVSGSRALYLRVFGIRVPKKLSMRCLHPTPLSESQYKFLFITAAFRHGTRNINQLPKI